MFGKLNQEITGSHTDQEWQDLVIVWGSRCFYCARPVLKNAEKIADQLTKDHLIPISRGGVDFIWNIVPACFNCNRLKGNLTVDEFREERPVFFTDEQNARRKSFEEASVRTTPVADLAQQAVKYLDSRMRMEPSPEQIASRRDMLRAQVAEIKRLRLIDAGQLTLPIFGDNSPKKLMETESQTLVVSQGIELA